jgi:6-pyruvoyl-tetrahydropterin synthase
MFSVTVADHTMIAHSFQGAVFGPAQRLHGATYVVEAEMRGPALDDDGILVDIGAARALLRDILAGLDYRNLDDEPAFRGRNTTTEALARHLHEQLAARCREGALGPGGQRLASLRMTLRESPVAWAAYEGAI